MFCSCLEFTPVKRFYLWFLRGMQEAAVLVSVRSVPHWSQANLYWTITWPWFLKQKRFFPHPDGAAPLEVNGLRATRENCSSFVSHLSWAADCSYLYHAGAPGMVRECLMAGVALSRDSSLLRWFSQGLSEISESLEQAQGCEGCVCMHPHTITSICVFKAS